MLESLWYVQLSQVKHACLSVCDMYSCHKWSMHAWECDWMCYSCFYRCMHAWVTECVTAVTSKACMLECLLQLFQRKHAYLYMWLHVLQLFLEINACLSDWMCYSCYKNMHACLSVCYSCYKWSMHACVCHWECIIAVIWEACMFWVNDYGFSSRFLKKTVLQYHNYAITSW